MTYTIKKLLLFIATFILIFSFTNGVFASESIDTFYSEITINNDGTVLIDEYITYDFGINSKRGIIREIPLTKVNVAGKKFLLVVETLGVTDYEGNAYNYVDESTKTTNILRIGDPDVFFTGQKDYKITYKVSGALTYFEDFDELYWNVIGTEWQVPIKFSAAKISFPNEIDSTAVKTVCYSGLMGSQDQDCTVAVVDDVILLSKGSELPPYNGLTFAATFPKGHFEILEPAPYYSIYEIIMFILLGIGAFLFYFVLPIYIFYIWMKEKAFIRKNQRIVTAWFDPPKKDNGDLYSPEASALMVRKKVDSKTLSSTVVRLAQAGYLKIIVEKKKITLFKLRELDDSVPEYEKMLFNILFKKGDEIDVSKIAKNVTATDNFNSYKSKISAELVADKLFSTNVIRRSEDFMGLAIFSIFFGNFLLFFSAILFGRNTTKITKKGIEKYSEAKSLENFLKSQDDKLDFQADRQMFFEKLLPYATAFGVEKVWIKRFSDINIANLTWIETADTNLLALGFMASSMNSSFNKISSPSSGSSSSGFSSGSSGGSSGGGGGGGGGGSW